jgi:hypothetical protein
MNALAPIIAPPLQRLRAAETYFAALTIPARAGIVRRYTT